jgi:hypothetical protein
MSTKMVAFAIAVLAGLVSAGCDKNPIGLTENNPTAAQTTISKRGALAAVSFPSWYKELAVSWNTQFIPGSTTATKNCGQACATMIDGYYKLYCPGSTTIVNVDRWLDAKFPGLGYATPNSYYTHVIGPRYALSKVIQEYYRYSSYYEIGATEVNLGRIFKAINAGVPVIACVEISGGAIVPWNATDHWVVVVGYNQGNGGEVILHNPGTTDSAVGGKGKFHHMRISDFMKSWAYAGGYWMPVMNGSSRYF